MDDAELNCVMTRKRIGVSMSDECAAILKEYCSFFGISQSDALYLFARAAIHQHSLHCQKVESILNLRQKEIDKRAKKLCFGFACVSCAHAPKCTAGLYEGLFEISNKFGHLFIKEGPLTQAIYILKKEK